MNRFIQNIEQIDAIILEADSTKNDQILENEKENIPMNSVTQSARFSSS
jgi:hypothetical protein